MAIDFDKSYALYEEGRAAMERGSSQQAIDLFRASIAAAPHPKTYEMLGECLLRERRFDEAVEALTKAIEQGNRPLRAHFLIAKALIATGRPADAVRHLDAAIELNPQYRAAIDLRSTLTQTPSRPVAPRPLRTRKRRKPLLSRRLRVSRAKATRTG